MASMFMRFPGGKVKVVTLSYDDNVEADVRLVQTMKKYGLKGTFNINSGQFPPEGSVGSMGCGHRRLTVKQSTELHKDSGMEIACHGVTHPFLDHLPASVCVQEVLEDRKRLEEIYGGIVRGLAYPFGTYNDDVVAALKACGIAYARAVVSTEKFDLPSDWLRWAGTCHHGNPKLMKLAQRFVEDKRNWTPMVFYLWGHSYEFDDNDNWNIIEEFGEYIGGREDIWYATNIEIYDYVTAWKQMIYSADGSVAYNPTNTELFIKTAAGVFSLLPGETKKIL
ncbi:MAG: polysaccharide deacetylase family protein [Oscillospiraceae bacterium]|nr:polysaccharide deacetylase family protein [Oscillospiraceae bacterium]